MFKDSKKYVINLPERTDRRDAFLIQAIDHNILNFEFQTAVKKEEGWKGCFESHLEVIKKAKRENLPYVTIFEDDIVLCNNFQNYIEIVERSLPYDWDVFYLAGNNIHEPLDMINPVLGKCKTTLSTVAYMVKSTVYDHILSMPCSAPIDVQLHRFIQSDFNCYCAHPNLCWQAQGYSDVLKTNVNYKREYKYRWQ